MKRSRGFTLVESLVVLGIVGALIAAAAPNLTLMHERARRTGVRGVMQSLHTAMQAYSADNQGTYPGADLFMGGDGMGITYWFPGGDPVGTHGSPVRGRLPANPYTGRLYNTADEDMDGETYFGYLSGPGQNGHCLTTDPGCPYVELPAPSDLQGTVCVVSREGAANPGAMAEYGIIGYGRDVSQPMFDIVGKDASGQRIIKYFVLTN